MSDALEDFLQLMCKSAVKSQSNEQQTLYVLSDAKDAKLAYDILAACGLVAKFFPDNDNDAGKLYVQNASLAASGDKIAAATAQGPLMRQLKDVLENQPGNYTLSYVQTPTGRQLTVSLPQEAKTPAASEKTTQNAAQSAASAAPAMRKATPKKPEETILSGPAVARTAIPKSMKASATDEDPLIKRAMLYLSGRAFTSTAWLVFIALILAVVFSILVTIRGFLCPDVATDAKSIPSYCPKKNVVKQQQ